MINKVIFSISLCLLWLTSLLNAGEALQPNIVFILTDDQSFDALGSAGNSLIKTPNLDKLAAQGTTLTHVYNQGSWSPAVCAPSRAMINTGRNLFETGMQNKEVPLNARPDYPLWGETFRNAGYETFMTGKWHVEAPAGTIFKEAQHIRPGMPGDRRGELGAAIKKWKKESGDMKDWNDYMPLGYGRPTSTDDTEWSPTDSLQGGFWEGGQHWTEALKDDAIGFINEAKKSEKPFFMYLAFNAPHDPRQAPQEYQDMYDTESLSIPESFQPLYPEREDMGNGPALRDAALAPFPRTEYATQVHKKEYYASITYLDAQVGKILKAVEESGKADNTYIIYTADHGLAVGEHGLFGKQNMYDHSMRPPLMIVGPGIKAGTRLDADVYIQDIMATALDLAGSSQTDSVFFQSFMPQALGQVAASNYDGIYGGYKDLQRMIRKDGYKMILYPEIKKIKLFNLTTDPLEMSNIADNADQKERIKTLFTDLIKLQTTVGDKMDLKELYNL